MTRVFRENSCTVTVQTVCRLVPNGSSPSRKGNAKIFRSLFQDVVPRERCTPRSRWFFRPLFPTHPVLAALNFPRELESGSLYVFSRSLANEGIRTRRLPPPPNDGNVRKNGCAPSRKSRSQRLRHGRHYFLDYTTRASRSWGRTLVERRFSLFLWSPIKIVGPYPTAFIAENFFSCCAKLSGHSCHAFVPRSSKGSISDKSNWRSWRLGRFSLSFFFRRSADYWHVDCRAKFVRFWCFCGTRYAAHKKSGDISKWIRNDKEKKHLIFFFFIQREHRESKRYNIFWCSCLMKKKKEKLSASFFYRFIFILKCLLIFVSSTFNFCRIILW